MSKPVPPATAPLEFDRPRLDDQYLWHLRQAAYDWGIEDLEAEPIVARRAAIWLGRNVVTLIDELRLLREEEWTRFGIVEIAARNQRVYDYMNHWEFRAVKAEAALADLRRERDAK